MTNEQTNTRAMLSFESLLRLKTSDGGCDVVCDGVDVLSSGESSGKVDLLGGQTDICTSRVAFMIFNLCI